MKPLIVGEAPSKNEDVPNPISGRVGKRLAECCGTSLDEFLHRFERTNLLKVRQDTKEKGFEFDEQAASLAAYEMADPAYSSFALHEGRVVILLGKRVAAAFGASPEYFSLQRVGTKADVYVVPHPSGVNRWWNEAANRGKMHDFMQYLMFDSIGHCKAWPHDFDLNGNCKRCPKVIMTVHPETATGR